MAVGHAIEDIAIAPETTPGSPDTDGLPDASGLTFATAFVKSGFAMDGQVTPQAPLDCATAGYHTEPPEPIAGWSDSDSRSHQIRQGPLTITFYIQGLGDHTTFDTHELYLPLNTVLRSVYDVAPAAEHPADTDAVGGVAISDNEFTPTTIARFVVGDMISVIISGSVQYSCVVAVGGGTVKHSPAFSRALTNVSSDVVRLCRTYYLPTTVGLPNGDTFATRYSWQGRRCIAYGCRLGNHTWGFENQYLTLQATVENLGIRDETAGTPANGSIARMSSGGRVPLPQIKPARAVISDANPGGATPYMLNSFALTTHDDQPWSIQVNVPLSSTGGTTSPVLRGADLEIAAKPSITATVPVEPNEILRTMQQGRERRNLVLPCGPGNQGFGAGFALMGAYLAETPIVGVADRQMDRPVFMVGEWEGDTVAAGTAAARVPFKFALPQ